MAQKMKAAKSASLLGRIFIRRGRPLLGNDDDEEGSVKNRFEVFTKVFNHKYHNCFLKNSTVKPNNKPSLIKFENIDFSSLISRALTEVTFLRYLQKREDYRNSVRAIMVPSSPILGLTKYITQKALVDHGYNKTGLYVINSDAERDKFCDRAIRNTFLHKSIAIDRLLDCDFIDTENTDYTYIRDEDNLSECSNIPVIDHKEPVINITTSLTLEGKDVSIYETKYIEESSTAQGSA
ncbi:unnamed protein product [Moneuplotes crassus]|uniref:Uncharacterized protein n=1 Tax=Euplotes crassus TaxID=5936 RepID=A0AAD1XW16_EUPCR|nr:unnamed protein product [Moneuplotes crassus]